MTLKKLSGSFRSSLIGCVSLLWLMSCSGGKDSEAISAEQNKIRYDYSQPHRPQFHFSPPEQWMNDPNGMVYYQGEYHLFYQYYPDSTVWGPMHWGHAISEDLVHWEHYPIALYPDSLGYIFSGSAVVDWNNTSGFGTEANPPLVAIYTYHDPNREGQNNFQYQGIAYSIDKGRSWTKYEQNPVLAEESSVDFRDPKVFWHLQSEKWVMTLAEGNQVGFYGSQDLKHWESLSKFGIDQGSHLGVWECPDLFQIKDQSGIPKWVLLVSIGPGGSRGSDTQYFIGQFSGSRFINDYEPDQVFWMDHGWDNYAGVTWSDVPQADGRRIFMGWMSNWLYATRVPTVKWRSAMTLPRELAIYPTRTGHRLASRPIQEMQLLYDKSIAINRTVVAGTTDWTDKLMGDSTLLNFEFQVTDISRKGRSWKLIFGNTSDESLVLGYDDVSDQYFIDRRNAGAHEFHEEFAAVHYAPRISEVAQMPVSIWLDRSSVELFGDNGTVVMTDLFFPSDAWTSLRFESGTEAVLVEGSVYALESVWD